MSQKKSVKVMLVDTDSARSALLAQALEDAGFSVVSKESPGPSLLAKVARVLPDMIVIDTETPDRDMLESMSILSEHNPMPVVMFADSDNEKVVQEAIRSGVSGYISGGVDKATIKSVMNVSIARFREYQALKDELKLTKTELEDSKLIDKAKRLLMKHKSSTEDEAYEAMRKMSMDTNKKMSQIAEDVIGVLEL